MAKAVWLQKLQAKLKENPLYDVEGTVPHAVRCKNCGGHGKKVPLYAITNYNEFCTCDTCKTVYR